METEIKREACRNREEMNKTTAVEAVSALTHGDWSLQLGDGACAAARGVGVGPPGELRVASCGVRRPRCGDAEGPGKSCSDSQVGRHKLGSVKSPGGEDEDQAGNK